MKRTCCLTLLASVLAAVPVARANDFVMPHVGRLLTGSDAPVEGLRKMRFSIFSRSADSPGENNLLWEETYTNVEVQGGLYSVDLGDATGNRAPLDPDSLRDADALWLEVTVYETAEAETGTTLSPRLRISGSLIAAKADDAFRLGGAPAADYLKKADFEAFKTALTGGGQGGLSIPWNLVSGKPADFADDVDDGLRQVAVGGTALTGTGTGESPLVIRAGGIEANHLADGAVTAAKLAEGAVTPNVFANGSMSPEKLVSCPEGQILKMQSGKWQCGFDTGSGGTLTFNVLAPIEQVPGQSGQPATVQVKDGGIEAVKLADGAVTAAKLASESGSLNKVSGGAMSASAAGSVGIGIGDPFARLELAHFDAAGTIGTGDVSYTANATTVAVAGGSFAGQVLVGDLVQLGNLGWRTVMTVAGDGSSLTIDSGYGSAYSGTFRVRRATMRLGSVLQTGLGNVGIGTTPLFALDVQGDVNARAGKLRERGLPAAVPPGAVMHFAMASCPEGWVKANGASLSRASYPELAAALGQTGANFNVPDLRGEFIRSLDDGRSIDKNRTVRSAQGQDFKSFSMWNEAPSASGYSHGPVYFAKAGKTGNLFGGYWSNDSGKIRVEWDGSEIRPRNVALLACIKH